MDLRQGLLGAGDRRVSHQPPPTPPPTLRGDAVAVPEAGLETLFLEHAKEPARRSLSQAVASPVFLHPAGAWHSALSAASLRPALG